MTKKMIHRINWYLWTAGLMILMSVIGFGKSTYADNMSFSVLPVLPENQSDSSKTYFDLKMNPNQEEVLEVNITNNTDEEITVLVETNTALTNDNGVADYSQSKKEKDSSLQVGFSDIAKAEEKEITLQGKETKAAKIQVNMPAQEYDGLILGGLYFTEKEKDSEEKMEKGMQIKNKFAYVIGVSLRENDHEVKTILECNDVTPDQVNYRNVVKINLQNTQPEIVKDLNVDAKVYTEKGTEVLHETKKEKMKMVPNSNFNYAVSWDNKEFKPGKYRVEIESEADGQLYKWVKYFTISADKANKLNDKAVELEEESKILLYVVIGLAVLLIVLAIAFIIYWRKNKQKAELKES
ncbi:TPA: DUF916 and DUF3324 domain-containing protein [Enterococcus faecium]